MIRVTSWVSLLALLAIATACSKSDDEEGTEGTDGTDDPSAALAEHPHPNNDLVVPDWTEGIEAIVEYSQETFNNRSLIYYVPEQPLGMIFAFHGTSMSASNNFSVEWTETWNYMNQAGFGVVSTDSAGNGWDSWSDLDSNPDWIHLSQIRDYLMESTDWNEDTPIFAMGFSGGGGFSPSFADMALQNGWDFRAFGSHCSGADHTPNVPAMRFINENDPKIDVGYAQAAHDDWVEAGIPAEWRFLEEEPLDPMRFLKIAAYDEEDSQTAFDELIELGLITAGGERIPPLGRDLEKGSEEMSAGEALDYFKANAEETTWIAVVSLQMSAVWRLHTFAADYALDERDFFLDQL